ncbi:MAG: DegT/DnrJ/EryC1/StrS family aminotransferase [Dehalococcoidales bacterium]
MKKLGVVFKLLFNPWRALAVGFFQRRSFYQLNYTSGTTTLRECRMVLASLFKLEPLQNGKYISIFEKRVADLLGVKYTFSFSAGRMALYAILKAMDIKDGDEIIMPGYTCAVVPSAIIYAGAKPVYIDISARDYNIDVTKIEAKITKKTKAIIAQHTYGNPCNVAAIKEICRRHNLVLIEDCAHTMGTSYKGSMLGTLGDVAFFSTDHTKFISTSIGGIAVTNNESIGKKLQKVYENTLFLSKINIIKILLQFIVVNMCYSPRISFFGRHLFSIYRALKLDFLMANYAEIKKPAAYPYPARMSNLQAKIGISQMDNLQKNIDHRRAIYTKYQEVFNDFRLKNTTDAPLRVILEVNNPDEWVKRLSPVLAVESWFDSCFQGKKDKLEEVLYSIGECPVAESLTKRNINLPTHLKVKPADVAKIARLLNQTLIKGIMNERKK